MQATAEPDVLADLEAAVRANATMPLPERVEGVHDFLTRANGVLHVGAHTGQERELYGDLPVVWVEALPLVFEVLQDQIADKPNQRAFCYLVADGRRHPFGLASNNCQSSSIFDLKNHRKLWPDVGYVARQEMDSKTLAWIIDRHDLDLDVYDALVLDVQGAELLVLQGAGANLRRFKWVQVEAADFDAYAGGCQLADLDAFLLGRGFVRAGLARVASGEVGTYYEALYENQTDAAPPAGRNGTAAEPPSASVPLRLNLGAGDFPLPGFVSIDRKSGQEAYPLPYDGGTAEEIVASHVLEHFSHRETSLVLQEWIRVLKPGGKIRLAVPDFEEVAKLYLAGAAVNVQGYLMGGHTDADDRHGCLFDREALTELMVSCGLERIGPWTDRPRGCAAGPHTLNLQGFKPVSSVKKITGLRACLSVPRFGPLMHPRCWDRAAFQLGLEGRSTSSCYWAQQISNLMEDAVADPACEVVLTMDFDTVFSATDVLELYRLLLACPDVDAVIPMQAKRGTAEVLMSIAGRSPGTCRTAIATADLTRHLLPANTGHFGLTLFRADSLRRFPRPWMVPKPNKDGLWRDGHTDADIDFWQRFRDAGLKACLAPRVVVGHLEEIIRWPGKELQPVLQTPAEYEEIGIPADVVR